MELMELFIALLIAGLIGLAIGQTRGRACAGVLLGVLLGPVGWLLVLVGSNPKKEKEEKEKQTIVRHQFYMQQAPTHSNPTPPPPGARETIHIAKGGETLGVVTIDKARRMLDEGSLSFDDCYFDDSCNEWIELAGHPTLVEG